MARTATTKGGRKPNKTRTETTPKPASQNIDQPPTEPASTVEQKLEKFRQSQTKAKGWMWLGVVSISTTIFFFWGWSLISNFSLFSWKHTRENEMIKKTQTDWNEIFTKTKKTEAEKKLLKEQLGGVIDEIKKQATAEQTTNITNTTSTNSTSKNSTTTTSTIR